MRLLYVVDGRSPIALNWIEFFTGQGHEVHLVSTFPCQPDLPLASVHTLDVALSGTKARGNRKQAAPADRKGIWSGGLVNLRTKARQVIGPFTLPGAARRLKEIAASIRPDLVHAMRIPYEGMAAALAGVDAPLLLSVWGNDFTLHASATPMMSAYTRLALQRADALHADCYRDIRLARAWGLDAARPVLVCPGNGGIRGDLFYPALSAQEPSSPQESSFLVTNPRGFRAYIRSDTFFRAARLALEADPEIRFVCPAMAAEPQAQHWVQELGISGQVDLLPAQTRQQMADLFRRSAVMVSPATHDGTPNTFLEALACGAFPIVGDLESLREWVVPGVNGLVFDPSSASELAEAILMARSQPLLLARAAEENIRIVTERAGFEGVMEKAAAFYEKLITQKFTRQEFN